MTEHELRVRERQLTLVLKVAANEVAEAMSNILDPYEASRLRALGLLIMYTLDGEPPPHIRERIEREGQGKKDLCAAAKACAERIRVRAEGEVGR